MAATLAHLPEEPALPHQIVVLADHDRLPTREQGGYSYEFPTVMNQEVSGVTLTTPINRARPTAVPSGSLEDYMYAYEGFGFYPAPTYAGAQACPTPVDPVPVPVNIVFQ